MTCSVSLWFCCMVKSFLLTLYGLLIRGNQNMLESNAILGPAPSVVILASFWFQLCTQRTQMAQSFPPLPRLQQLDVVQLWLWVDERQTGTAGPLRVWLYCKHLNYIKNISFYHFDSKHSHQRQPGAFRCSLRVSQLILCNSFWISSAYCLWRMYTTKRNLELYWCFNVFPFLILRTHTGNTQLWPRPFLKQAHGWMLRLANMFPVLWHTEWKKKEWSTSGLTSNNCLKIDLLKGQAFL